MGRQRCEPYDFHYCLRPSLLPDCGCHHAHDPVYHGRRDGRWVHPSPTLPPVLRPSSLPDCGCHHDRDPVYYRIWVVITGVGRRDGRRVRQTTPVGGHDQNDDSHRPVVNEVTGVEIVDLLPVCGWYHARDLVYYRVGVVITVVEMVGPIR